MRARLAALIPFRPFFANGVDSVLTNGSGVPPPPPRGRSFSSRASNAAMDSLMEIASFNTSRDMDMVVAYTFSTRRSIVEERSGLTQTLEFGWMQLVPQFHINTLKLCLGLETFRTTLGKPHRMRNTGNRRNAREGGRELIQKARGSKRPSFIYVNNRLEGNALSTIDAMVK